MKPSRIQMLSATSALVLLSAAPALAATSIGINFLGRDGTVTGNPGVPPMPANGMAGVVPQANWNNIDNQYGYATANSGTASGLFDASGAASPISLTFDCNDSWYNDVDPTNITTANAKLFNGIIKSSTARKFAPFGF